MLHTGTYIILGGLCKGRFGHIIIYCTVNIKTTKIKCGFRITFYENKLYCG